MHDTSAPDTSVPREHRLTRASADIDSDIVALKTKLRLFEKVLIGLYMEGIEAYGEPYSEGLFEEWRQVIKQTTDTGIERVDPALRVKVLDAIYTYSKSVDSIEYVKF